MSSTLNDSPFKPNCLAGHVALITGGGSGIGFGIAKNLGLHGAKVVIMGRRENFLKDACAQLTSLNVSSSYFVGDVRNNSDSISAISHTIKSFGSLSILVNCAAGNFLAFSGDLSVNAFRTVLEIDTLGVFTMCRNSYQALKAAAEEFKKKKLKITPCVVNISATLHYGATWFQTHATAAKAGIDAITRQLGLEWGEDGIRSVGIAPGPIADTPGTAKLAGDKSFTNTIPLGRMGTTDDIGFTAVYLASVAGNFVSGETVIVDGATWLWQPAPMSREKVREISGQREKGSRDMKAKL